MWRRQDPHARLVLKTQLPDFHGPTAHDTPTRWQLPGVARSRRELGGRQPGARRAGGATRAEARSLST